EGERPVLFILRHCSRSRKCHSNFIRLAHICPKDALPIKTFAGDVLNVEHKICKAFVEDARLHLEGNLPGEELISHVPQTSRRLRRNPNSHCQIRHECQYGQTQHRPEEPYHRNSWGMKCNTLTV